MAVNDHGLEAIRKAAEQVTPGDPSDYYLKTSPSPAASLLLSIDDTSTANVLYVGQAEIGSASSDPVWQIKKINQTSGVVVTWADGAAFSQVWDDRVGLVYT